MKATGLIMCFLLMFSFWGNSQKFNDLINLGKYEKANSELPKPVNGEKRVVFIGNSITEGWAATRPDFFKTNNFIGRGIGGQTSPQLLSRFRQDVINLNPVAVIINIGTNDIAENTGNYNIDFTVGNIISMAELAKANGIKVILSSVTPADKYPWRKDIENVASKINELNKRIKEYAMKNNIPYIDYYSVLHNDSGAMKKEYTTDGVHVTPKGYEIMEKAAKETIDKVL